MSAEAKAANVRSMSTSDLMAEVGRLTETVIADYDKVPAVAEPLVIALAPNAAALKASNRTLARLLGLLL